MSEIIPSLLEYFFATSESIFELTQSYKIYMKNTPIVHLSRQKSTKHGQGVNPFSMDWGRWADGTFTILKG